MRDELTESVFFRSMVSDPQVKPISFLTSEHIKELFQLWNNVYPQQLEYKEIGQLEMYIQSLENSYHLLLCHGADTVIGWAFSFDREGERWFAILLQKLAQRKGYGRELLNHLKNHDAALNGWMIDHDRYITADGKSYMSPLDFYKKCGFEILSDQRLELDIISAVKIRWSRD